MKLEPFFRMVIGCENKGDFDVEVLSRAECEPSDMFTAIACAIVVTIESLQKEYEMTDKDVENSIKVFNRILEMKLAKGGKVC